MLLSVSVSIFDMNFSIWFPCSWFVSMICWHGYIIVSFFVTICCVCYWFTLDVSINYSNMSLMLSLETMFYPSRLLRFEMCTFPCCLVVSFLLHVEFFEVRFLGCACFVSVRSVLQLHHIFLAKQSTGVHFFDRLCDFLWVIPVNADFFNHYF